VVGQLLCKLQELRLARTAPAKAMLLGVEDVVALQVGHDVADQDVLEELA
jgi:hypothetical protein